MTIAEQTNENPVRPAEERDLPQLAGLMEAYIHDFYGRHKPDPDRLAAHMRMLLRRERGIQFVAEREGRLTGFATLYFTFSTLRLAPVVVLNDLYVEESDRGTGTAAALFEQCRSYAGAEGYAVMSWETALDNMRAQAFYAKMGGERADWLSYSIACK